MLAIGQELSRTSSAKFRRHRGVYFSCEKTREIDVHSAITLATKRERKSENKTIKLNSLLLLGLLHYSRSHCEERDIADSVGLRCRKFSRRPVPRRCTTQYFNVTFVYVPRRLFRRLNHRHVMSPHSRCNNPAKKTLFSRVSRACL